MTETWGKEEKNEMLYASLEKSKPKVWNKTCPVCKEPMKRKGSFGKIYYRCPECKMKTNANGTITYNPASMPDDLTMKKELVRNWRNVIAQEKFIKDLKENKYNTQRYYEWGGIVLDLDKYGKDGKKLPGLKGEKKEPKEKEVEQEWREENEFDERTM